MFRITEDKSTSDLLHSNLTTVLPRSPKIICTGHKFCFLVHNDIYTHTHTHTHTHTEGAKKMYTHFKKGKNCIQIVILNLYR